MKASTIFLCLFIVGLEIIGPCQSACPQKCKTCKASEGRSAEGQDGGKSLGKNGQCEHYCSKWGFCGAGAQYSKDGVDCNGCKSGSFFLYTILISFYLSNTIPKIYEYLFSND